MADELYNQFKGEEPTTEAIINASNKVDYFKGKLNENRITDVLEKSREYWKCRSKYEKHIPYPNESKTPIYLDAKSREKVQQCVHALQRNKYIQKLLHPEGIVENPISENEQAILLNVQVDIPDTEPFILKLKAKLDNYTIDQETNTIVINDIKTIGKTVNYFNENFERFHYYRELAIYSWLLSLCAKKFYGMESCNISANCCVVSTIPDYYTKIYKLTKKDFAKGWKEFTYLLDLVAQYYSKGYRF